MQLHTEANSNTLKGKALTARTGYVRTTSFLELVALSSHQQKAELQLAAIPVAAKQLSSKVS
jgi:hypothetical protein